MKRLIAVMLLVLLTLPASVALSEAEWTYEIPLSAVLSEYTILVNRNHKLESDYIPGNMVSAEVRKVSSTVIELDAVVAAALQDMFDTAAKVTEYLYRVEDSDGSWVYTAFSDPDGMQLVLKSGYRSYSSQYTIYNNYLARNGGVDDGISSPPGSSEHQTGLAADVLSVDYNNTHQYMNSSNYGTPEAQWMEENAAAFGFIIRYPEDKEDITQVPYEPWHLRYVGREIAGYIKRTGLTLEEFTVEWQAALDAFLMDGGNVQAQLLWESTMAPAAVTTTVLDVYGDDGDPEVSLSMW
ncbi:MAG: M15 family metallopeptidase [Clostridiales bacterium]|nr:M15 family metallopeptidase [Clostridiales bacterium]